MDHHFFIRQDGMTVRAAKSKARDLKVPVKIHRHSSRRRQFDCEQRGCYAFNPA